MTTRIPAWQALRKVGRLLPRRLRERQTDIAAPTAPEYAPELAERDLPIDYKAIPGMIGGAITEVVLLCRHQPVRVANQLAGLFSGANIHLLAFEPLPAEQLAQLGERVRYTHCPDHGPRADYISRLPRPQVIVEVSADRQKLVWRFVQLFPYLGADGLYVLEHVPIDGSGTPNARLDELATLQDPQHASGRSWSKEILASCRGVQFQGTLALVRKGIDYRVKLRDYAADEILTSRYGSAWGEVVATRPPIRFVPRVRIAIHGDRDDPHVQNQMAALPGKIGVPQLTLRRYARATCWSMQRIAYDDYWLPDTFRHPRQRELTHRRLIRGSAWLARLPDDMPERAARHIEGPLFYFDTEYPGHFGHVLSEVVSRYWGWQRASSMSPDVRPLVSLEDDQKEIPRFQRQIFSALGIDVERIEYIQPREAVTVDNLYAATPMFSMPTYVSTELREPWDRIGAAMYRPGLVTPKRLFVSRRPMRIRSCLNTAEVEECFAAHGFEIFYPEDHDFADQVTHFVNADVLGGFAGSNMMTAMFAPDKKIVMIAADSFTANNDFLIAAVVGAEMQRVIGDAEVKHPEGQWTWAAFQSNFTVDIDRLDSAIKAAVAP